MKFSSSFSYKIINLIGWMKMKRIFGIILIISLSLTFLVISIEQSSYNKNIFMIL